MNQKKWTMFFTLIFLLSATSVWGQTYNLSWGFKSGRENEFERTITVEKYFYMITPDKPDFKIEDAVKEDRKKTLEETIKAECIVKWTLPKEGWSSGKAFVCVYHQEGKITLNKDNAVEVFDAGNPEHVKKIVSDEKYAESVKPLLGSVTGAYSFQIDLTQGKVLSTWVLEKGEKGKMRQTLLVNKKEKNPDPLDFGESYRQLPNRAVKLDTTWDTKQKIGPKSFLYHFKFSEATKYEGRQVAKIDITGEINKENPKLAYFEGTIVGQYTLDYIRPVMMLQELTNIEKDVYKRTDSKGKTKYYVFENKTHLLIKLKSTNVKD